MVRTLQMVQELEQKNYPNMIDWYSEELNSPRWTKLDMAGVKQCAVRAHIQQHNA